MKYKLLLKYVYTFYNFGEIMDEDDIGPVDAAETMTGGERA